MQRFADVAEAIAATTKKTEKVRLLAEYFSSSPIEEAAIAAVFFSGSPFPAYEETTLQVGGSLLWRLISEISQASDATLGAVYRKYGDLGDAAAEVFSQNNHPAPNIPLRLAELATSFRELAAARGASAKSHVLRELFSRAQPGEIRYIVKIILGDLRIGLRQSLVEEAIAKAYGAEPAAVQRAGMMLGDIAETLRLAAAGRLAEAHMRLFHPLGFMLASPAETVAEAFGSFSGGVALIAVEDKYDGIRAQAHVGKTKGSERRVRLFSRTLDEISASFPELPPALAALPGELVLDGEIVAWQRVAETSLNAAQTASSTALQNAARALPFSELQKRLGRKQVAESLRKSVPVAYLVFDVLYANGELVIDQPLRQRRKILDEIFSVARHPVLVPAPGPEGRLALEPAVAGHHNDHDNLAEVIRAPQLQANSPAKLDDLFSQARRRGNEGLMIKDLDSAYTPGRRGGAWLKLKRELATLDVVVTAAEYGHGKRAAVLSDYTFAVRESAESDRLLNIGKAYSGLTDVEIAQLTEWFLHHTLVDEGHRRQVAPLTVLEVAFNNVMRSQRYESGFALRFPRIVRIRSDKSPEEIDTLATLAAIFEKQKLGSA
jgi:DNA ligase-1